MATPYQYPYRQDGIGAQSPAGQALLQSLTAAEAQGSLNDEDGLALYKASKDTKGGQRQWWLELGMAAAGGILVGWLIGRAF